MDIEENAEDIDEREDVPRQEPAQIEVFFCGQEEQGADGCDDVTDSGGEIKCRGEVALCAINEEVASEEETDNAMVDDGHLDVFFGGDFCERGWSTEDCEGDERGGPYHEWDCNYGDMGNEAAEGECATEQDPKGEYAFHLGLLGVVAHNMLCAMKGMRWVYSHKPCQPEDVGVCLMVLVGI